MDCKILDYMEGFLVSKTLFTVCEMGLFDLLASSRLSGTEKLYLTRSIHYSSKTIYLCWHYLIDAVREGSNQYEKAFGVKVDDLFEAMYRERFVTVDNQSMTSDKAMGGARNKFYPKLSLSLTDSIVCIVDFFKDELLEADLYILARILHDWKDTQHRTTEKSTGPANQLYTPSSIPLSLLQSFSLMRKIRCDLTLLTLPHPPSSPWVTVSTKASCQTSPQIHTYTHTHLHTHTISGL
ncbi:acetylserotonin O-methyltransferase-like [Oncorhynchus nerka]|uniref:acetylserotonin O-methyltransferase-like n=1 Tax=Oncorhynchus nerka TaxID=8023 RepID=UPI0031B8680B